MKIDGGEVYFKPLATPGEIECCEVCALSRKHETTFDRDLAFWQKAHAYHTPWTSLGTGATFT